MPMNQVMCEISDLDKEEQLTHLGVCLGGIIQNNNLRFDNRILKGDIINSTADKGLSVRKWKCIPQTDIQINKFSVPGKGERKFSLLYFLTPGILCRMDTGRKIKITGSRNNLFLANDIGIELIFAQNQPVHFFEISITRAWLDEHLNDADFFVKKFVDQYILECKNSVFTEPFTLEEYKTIHELEVCMIANRTEDFFVRSRTYNLLIGFFSKIIKRSEASVIHTAAQYDQLIAAEMLIMDNIRKPPSIETIAKKVNMSVASLVRKFRLLHGKSIYEFHIDQKMELAKKMIVEHRIPINTTAKLLGYKQVSAFIETFTKQLGYTPGTLKQASRKFSFF